MDRFLWISYIQVLFSQLRKQEIQDGLAYVDRKNYLAALDKILPLLPLVEFYEGGQLCWQAGDYYFVHAGIRPGVKLDDQHFEDQLWIREDFINSTKNHGAVVVHGHTVFEDVDFKPNRIGIDTGAYQTGVLTALVLEGTEQRLLQTR